MNSRLGWNQILTGDHEHTAGQTPAQRFRCNCCGMGLRPSVPSNTVRSGRTDARQYPLPFFLSFGNTPLGKPPSPEQVPGCPSCLLLAPEHCWEKAPTTALALLWTQTPISVPPASTCSSPGSKPLTILGLRHSPRAPFRPQV